MTIGEFSRRSQLSLKALRLYERLGLPRPAAVGQRSGYRRYHESQLCTARLIVMLRLLGMPLPEVGRVVSASQAEAAEIAHAGRCGGAAGGHFVIFHGMVTADSDGPVEVCVPVGHPPRDPAEPAWRVEPAHREAFIPVTRTHFEVPAIWSIYDRLARWAAAPGRTRAGAPREVYRPVAEPLFAPAGQQICDVAIPFTASGQPGSSRSDLLTTGISQVGSVCGPLC
jgi:DNA-binding transcriptional MerR regulator